jgi:hypothetical protein
MLGEYEKYYIFNRGYPYYRMAPGWVRIPYRRRPNTPVNSACSITANMECIYPRAEDAWRPLVVINHRLVPP